MAVFSPTKLFISAILLFGVCVLAPSAIAGGLLGDILQGAGRATGIRPLEDLGRNGDAEHKRFKDNNPVYKRAEETASEIVRTPFSLACTANFEAIVGAVRTSCSRFSSQSTAGTDQAQIERAKRRLIDLGVIGSPEFSGISVRWCQGSFNGYGITPGPNEILLNRDLLRETVDDIALTLAHEMHHIRQYRSMGAGPFKCNYSQQFLQCGGCQNERHPMERDAYQFEASVAARMSNTSQVQTSSARVMTFSSLRGSGTFLDQRPQMSRDPDPPSFERRIKAAVPRLARATCTLEGKSTKLAPADVVAPCVDDLEVIFDDIGRWMIKDFKKNDLERERYYREIAQIDIDAACQILAHTVKDPSWQQTRVNLCKHGARDSISQLRQIIAD